MLPSALLILSLAPVGVQPQTEPVDTAAVARAFAIARDVAIRDRGRLWGRSLEGPLLVADPASMVMFAATPDSAGQLARHGSMFRGRVPQSITPANTAVIWSGRHWTMVRWPLPTDSTTLRELIAHELWHRIQDSLGLAGRELPNGHLERESARVWLRLEARALVRSLSATGTDQREALEDALGFRAARYRDYPGADTSEATLELNEGLAEYTGISLSGRTLDQQRERAITGLRQLETAESVVRSFAYASGPAYGLLLDQLDPEWRSAIRGARSLSRLLSDRAGIVTAGADVVAAADRYQVGEVRVAEAARAERKAARRLDLIARFVTGARLSAPLRQMRIGLDPTKVESLDSLGSVYGAARVTDEWGALDARAGALRINAEWKEVSVPLPAGYQGGLEGLGWTLSLEPGWRVVQAGPDHWRVERAPR